MKKNDKEWKRPYTSGNLIDDLVSWAKKVKVLGEVWGTLSWHENRQHGSEVLESCGETLGDIIIDYADLIETAATENSKSFVDMDENIVFPLARCQEVYDHASKNVNSPDVSHIDYQLKELDSFIQNAAMPACELKKKFESLRKEVLEAKK